MRCRPVVQSGVECVLRGWHVVECTVSGHGQTIYSTRRPDPELAVCWIYSLHIHESSLLAADCAKDSVTAASRSASDAARYIPVRCAMHLCVRYRKLD